MKTMKLFKHILLTIIFVFSFNQNILAGVEPDGSYTHVIPIEIPKGINDVQPNLALVYNSNAGNGMLGVGWTLSGLPTITRMNWGRGINYDGQDTYVGPEGRLAKIAGETYYRAEIDQSSKYEPLFEGSPELAGTCNVPTELESTEPCAWIVTDREGNTWYYGFTDNSRIEAVGKNGAVRIWALNRTTDPMNNSFNISFLEDPTNQGDGDYYPNQITYSNYSIKFGYGSTNSSNPDIRSDNFESYVSGSKVRKNYLLKWITAAPLNSATQIRSYNLEYLKKDNHRLLTKVNSWNNNTNEYKTLYENQYSSVEDYSFHSNKTWTTNYGSGWNDADNYSTIQYPDINGDGKPDICGRSDSGIKCGLNSGESFSEVTRWTTGFGSSWGYPQNYSTLTFLDLDSDGKSDICGRAETGIYCALSNGSSYNTYTQWSSYYGAGWNAEQHYSTIRFPDLNGDGRPDICGRAGNGIYCGLNNGTSFDYPSLWTPSYGSSWHIPQHYSTITYPDLNADGKSDICGRAGSGIYCGINNGSGFDPYTKWTNYYGAGWNAEQHYSTIRFPDLNGDGRPDICGRAGNGIYCGLNNGNGFDYPSLWTPCYGSSWHIPQHYSTITYPDLNADGKSDICGRAGSGIYCGMNNGRGFDPYTQWTHSYGNTWNAHAHYSTIKYPDLNGDGRPDICGRASGGIVCHTTKTETSAKLISTSKENSHNLRITYTPSQSFDESIIESNNCSNSSGAGYSQPCGISNSFPRFLVSEIQTSNSRASTGNESDATEDTDIITTYDYENGRVYPGTVQEKRDLGFETITEKTYAATPTGNELISSKVTNYRQEALIDLGNGLEKSPFTGLPMSITEYAGDVAPENLATKSEFFYNENETNLFPAGTANKDVVQPLLTKKVTSIYQGVTTTDISQLATKTFDFLTYDIFGRNTETSTCVFDSDVANTTSCAPNDVETIVTDYRPGWNLGELWNAESPTKITKTVDGTLVDELTFEYHPNAPYLLKTENKKLFCETGESCPGPAVLPVRQNITYNTNGLVTAETDANGNTTSFTYKLDRPGLVETVIKSVDSTPFTIAYGYDDFGRVSSKQGVNGQSTTYVYDGLGRITQVTNPLGGIINYTYSDGSPDTDQLWRKTEKTEETGSGLKTITKTEYYDGFDFVYKIETVGEVNPAEDKTIIVENKKSYQNGKLVTETSNPYFSDADPADIVWKKTTNDVLGRLERIDMVDGSHVRYEYGLDLVNGQNMTWVKKYTTNDSGAEVFAQTFFNKKGLLYKKVDQAGNETHYHFDLAGRVNQVELPEDESANRQSLHVKYDSFGRRTSLDDPSLGLTRFEYDAIGNLVKQTDTNNRDTLFSYDALNRVKTKQVNGGAITSYTYDETSHSFAKGRLTTITDSTGVHKFHYDQLGNIVQKIRDVSGLGTGFSETSTYSKFGRQLYYTFPDSTAQTIDYTGIGNHAATRMEYAASVLAEATFADYNATMQMQQKSIGDSTNKVVSNYTYNPGGYLQSLQTCKTGPGSTCLAPIVQDLSYEFYDYGMVKQITDNRSGSKVIDGINTDATQVFKYDDLGRLVKAYWGTELDPSETIEFGYNEIGNHKWRKNHLFEPTGTTLKFRKYLHVGQQVRAAHEETDPAGGDFVVDASNKTLDAKYDNLGNMIQKSETGVVWDYQYDDENRLIKVFKNNILNSEFTYDYRGQRVSKVYHYMEDSIAKTITTWYVSPTYEIRITSDGSQTHTKYMMLAGKGKIASRTKPYSPMQAVVFQSDRHFAMAGLITIDTFDNLTNKLTLNFLGFASHPGSGPLGKKAIQSLFIVVLLLLMWFAWRKRDRQFKSSFAAWQKFTAAPLLCIFFLASCQSADSSSSGYAGEISYIGDDGSRLTTMDLSGPTTGGVPEGTYYYHTNHLGSSTVITDENGLVTTRLTYNPFGEVVQSRSWGLNAVTHKFTSQELDEETGLMYYNARFYDPSIGRFLTADTIVPNPTNAQHFNRYAYVINNPIKYTDPTGHEPDEGDPDYDDFHDSYDAGNASDEQAKENENQGSKARDRNDSNSNTNVTQSSTYAAPLNTGGLSAIITGIKAFFSGVRVTGLVKVAALASVFLAAMTKKTGDATLDGNSNSFNTNCNIDPNSSNNMKSLSKGEIKKMKKAGINPHDLKPKIEGSKFDLFKDRNGDIHVKRKDGCGPGDWTGYNIEDF